MSQAPSSPGSELEAVSLFQKGNKEAFEQLYDRYAPLLFGAICRIIQSNAQLAENVLRQSFIHIWQHKSSYDPAREHLFAWMSKCARNIAISLAGNPESVENISQKENRGTEFYVNNDGKLTSDVPIPKAASGEKEDEIQDKALELIYVYGKSLKETSQFLNRTPALITAGLKGALNRLKVKAVV